MEEKNYPEHNARHAVARRIAVLALGVMKIGKKFSYQGVLKKESNDINKTNNP